VETTAQCRLKQYEHFEYSQEGYYLHGKLYKVGFFGRHNFANMKAAYEVCKEMGVSDDDFTTAMRSFETPDKRLNILYHSQNKIIIRDFAHAPSKVRSTVQAIIEQYGDKQIHVLLELHTYSSLNEAFLSEYEGVFQHLEQLVVCYNPKTLEIKKMDAISEEVIRQKFNNQHIRLKTTKAEISDWLAYTSKKQDVVILIMSSGHLGGVSLDDFVNNLS
jgi:UDP-N-acetylmuramate: L-alanyl-gamma-D-glutamyl-meso-diaminopimelate ligase